MIYETYDLVANKIFYFCPDQASIDRGKAYGYTGEFFVGGSTQAEAILSINQQRWLEHNKDLFSVNKDTPVTEGIQWEPCDLETEAPNEENTYNVFAVLNGEYYKVVGLEAAKAKLEEVKANVLVHDNLGEVFSFAEWEPIPVNPNIVTGTQTL